MEKQKFASIVKEADTKKFKVTFSLIGKYSKYFQGTILGYSLESGFVTFQRRCPIRNGKQCYEKPHFSVCHEAGKNLIDIETIHLPISQISQIKPM
jgi:hypothetical protein